MIEGLRLLGMKLQVTHPSIGTFAFQLPVGAPVVLGRDTRHADLELPWDPRVSRTHARIWFEEGRCYYEDLGSRNGSYRDGTRLGEPVCLEPGVPIMLGDTSLELAAEYESPWAEVTESGAPSLNHPALDPDRSVPDVMDAVLAPGPLDPPEPTVGPRPTIRFTGPARIRIEGPGLQNLWREELSRGRLFAAGHVPVPRGSRVWIDVNLEDGFHEISAEVVHVGPGPRGEHGAGLAIASIPPGLRGAFEGGADQTSMTTMELEPPVELIEAAEGSPPIPSGPPSTSEWVPPEVSAQRFVSCVAADDLYAALDVSPDSSDDVVREALERWNRFLSQLAAEDEIPAAIEELIDPLARALALTEAQGGNPMPRLRYDFARGLVFPERRRQLAECGEGPSLALLATAWRRAFPARSERARRLWTAAERAALAGQSDEGQRLKAQAISLAPFQHP